MIDEELSLDDVIANQEKTKNIQTLDSATKRAGRPRQTDEKADQRVTLYFTKSDIEEIEKFCFNERVKVGTYIKDTFLNNFTSDKEIQDKNILDIEKYLNEQNPKELGEAILKMLSPKK